MKTHSWQQYHDAGHPGVEKHCPSCVVQNEVFIETPLTIYKWQLETFGRGEPLRIAKRMLEEAEELVEAIERGESTSDIWKEIADVYIVLCGVAGASGSLTLPLNLRFQLAVDEKMKINRARKWKLQNDGTAYHERTEAEIGI